MLLNRQNPMRDGALTGRRMRGRRETTHVSPSIFLPHVTMAIVELGRMQQREVVVVGTLEMNKERSSGLKLSLGVVAAVGTSTHLERRLAN